jgi:hypothetical protein
VRELSIILTDLQSAINCSCVYAAISGLTPSCVYVVSSGFTPSCIHVGTWSPQLGVKPHTPT